DAGSPAKPDRLTARVKLSRLQRRLRTQVNYSQIRQELTSLRQQSPYQPFHHHQLSLYGETAFLDQRPGLVDGYRANLLDLAVLVAHGNVFAQHAFADQHVLDLITLGQPPVHARDDAQGRTLFQMLG